MDTKNNYIASSWANLQTTQTCSMLCSIARDSRLKEGGTPYSLEGERYTKNIRNWIEPGRNLIVLVYTRLLPAK